jgi:hypothetical protein
VGQLVQLEDFVTAWKLPAAQLMQLAEPVAEA